MPAHGRHIGVRPAIFSERQEQGRVLVNLLGQVVEFEVRQQSDEDRTLKRIDVHAREMAPRVLKVVQGEADLLEIVLALDAVAASRTLLDRGQQQADQDGDDRDDDEQFDQRHPAASSLRVSIVHG